MFYSDLPSQVAVLGQKDPSGTWTFKGYRNADGVIYTGAWETAEHAKDWLASFKREHPIAIISAEELFLALMAQPVQYLLYGLTIADGDPATDEFKPTSVGQKSVSLWEMESVWDQLRIVLENQGVSEEDIAIICDMWLEHPEYKPMDCITKIPEVVARARARIDPEAENVISMMAKTRGKDPKQAVEAWRILRPSANCPRCGTLPCLFDSMSPNKLAAVWRCGECGRTMIVKRDAPSTTHPQKRDPIPKDVQREVWQRDGGRCRECGSREYLEFDHVIPVSKGGASTVRNVQLLCQECNRNKSACDPGT